MSHMPGAQSWVGQEPLSFLSPSDNSKKYRSSQCCRTWTREV